MTEVVIGDVETGLRELFKKAYFRNCEIEGEELSEGDRLTLEDLDSIEILENLKDLLENLLSSKQDLKHTDRADLVSRCEQFESMLQKLEADVRMHIRVEQQLKLHADATEAKLEELQGLWAKKESGALREVLRGKDSEVLRRQSDSSTDLPGTDEGPALSHRRVLSMEEGRDLGAARLYESAQQLHQALLRLEKESMRLKVELDKRGVETEKVKIDYERVLRELQLLRVKNTQTSLARKKSDEKSLERIKVSRPTPDRALTDRLLRKSTDKAEGYKHTDSSVSKSRLDGGHGPDKRRSHMRSGSDKAKRPLSSIRAYAKPQG